MPGTGAYIQVAIALRLSRRLPRPASRLTAMALARGAMAQPEAGMSGERPSETGKASRVVIGVQNGALSFQAKNPAATRARETGLARGLASHRQ